MKYGHNFAPEEQFQYWVLPDKPHSDHGFGTEWDRRATAEQAVKLRGWCATGCKGLWMETNHRYFFELEEDSENFKVIAVLMGG
jgi:hypothetical protein